MSRSAPIKLLGAIFAMVVSVLFVSGSGATGTASGAALKDRAAFSLQQRAIVLTAAVDQILTQASSGGAGDGDEPALCPAIAAASAFGPAAVPAPASTTVLPARPRLAAQARAPPVSVIL